MPLTVEPDPVIPNRVNIIGDGFPFTLVFSNSRVDITALGRPVEVTFVSPRANIQWGAGYNIPSYFIRSENDGTYYPILPDWSSGVTLGEVSHGDDFVVYDKLEYGSNWSDLTDIGAYGSKLYLTFSSSVFRIK